LIELTEKSRLRTAQLGRRWVELCFLLEKSQPSLARCEVVAYRRRIMILAFSASHANVMNINGGIACLDVAGKHFAANATQHSSSLPDSQSSWRVWGR
jgi:hypothetical protein